MADTHIEVVVPGLAAAFQAAPALVLTAMRRELKLGLMPYTSRLIQERLSGTPLARRTGTLARSWGVEVFGESIRSLRGVVFSTARHARIHEQGGVVRPVHAKMLAIPLQAMRTPAGVARFHTPLRLTLKGAFFKTWIQKSKRGNLILMGQKTKRSEPVPLFVLKRQVTIPPRMGAERLLRLFAETTLKARLSLAIKGALRLAIAKATPKKP